MTRELICAGVFGVVCWVISFPFVVEMTGDMPKRTRARWLLATCLFGWGMLPAIVVFVVYLGLKHITVPFRSFSELVRAAEVLPKKGPVEVSSGSLSIAPPSGGELSKPEGN